MNKTHDNLSGRPLRDSLSMYRLRAGWKKNAKRDVDPPGQIESRPIGCIDTQGARGPTNFHGRKGKKGPKLGSEKKLEIAKNSITVQG